MQRRGHEFCEWNEKVRGNLWDWGLDRIEVNPSVRRSISHMTDFAGHGDREYRLVAHQVAC